MDIWRFCRMSVKATRLFDIGRWVFLFVGLRYAYRPLQTQKKNCA